jgi:hypothetical protein
LFYITKGGEDILRAFQKNKFHYEFNPGIEKAADTVPLYSFYMVPIWIKL